MIWVFVAIETINKLIDCWRNLIEMIHWVDVDETPLAGQANIPMI